MPYGRLHFGRPSGCSGLVQLALLWFRCFYGSHRWSHRHWRSDWRAHRRFDLGSSHSHQLVWSLD